MKRFRLAAVVTLGGFAVAVACGEPYEGEIPNTSAPVRDGGGEDEDAASDASLSPRDDAEADASDAKADVDPCSDRDKDGFVSKACEGGTDCDDDDDRAFPDAGFVADEPTLVTNGDWDCDGKTSAELPINLKCSDHTTTGVGTGCAFEGFKGDPGCGKSGDYVKCKPGGLLGMACLEDSVSVRVQRCK